MAKPTEDEKKDKPQEWEEEGKMYVKDKQMDVKFKVKTKPNQTGGYDTRIQLPVSPLGTKTN